MKIKADLLTGNAVVLFAYGLSGSGKTFTVFGPDAVDEPEVRLLRAQKNPTLGCCSAGPTVYVSTPSGMHCC